MNLFNKFSSFFNLFFICNKIKKLVVFDIRLKASVLLTLPMTNHPLKKIRIKTIMKKININNLLVTRKNLNKNFTKNFKNLLRSTEKSWPKIHLKLKIWIKLRLSFLRNLMKKALLLVLPLKRMRMQVYLIWIFGEFVQERGVVGSNPLSVVYFFNLKLIFFFS